MRDLRAETGKCVLKRIVDQIRIPSALPNSDSNEFDPWHNCSLEAFGKPTIAMVGNYVNIAFEGNEQTHRKIWQQPKIH